MKFSKKFIAISGCECETKATIRAKKSGDEEANAVVFCSIDLIISLGSLCSETAKKSIDIPGESKRNVCAKA
jgi:hypothetical protein